MPYRNSDVNAVNSVNPVRGQHSQPCQYGQCRQKTADGGRQSLHHWLLGNWGLAQARREVTEQATGDRAGQMAVP